MGAGVTTVKWPDTQSRDEFIGKISGGVYDGMFVRILYSTAKKLTKGWVS